MLWHFFSHIYTHKSFDFEQKLMQHATTGLLILNVPIIYQETPVPNIVPVELPLLTLYWLGLPARTIQLHSWSPRYEERFLMNSVKFISPLGHGDGCSVHIFFLKKCNAHADKEI